jgi:hypothetical protein
MWMPAWRSSVRSFAEPSASASLRPLIVVRIMSGTAAMPMTMPPFLKPNLLMNFVPSTAPSAIIPPRDWLRKMQATTIPNDTAARRPVQSFFFRSKNANANGSPIAVASASSFGS